VSFLELNQFRALAGHPTPFLRVIHFMLFDYNQGVSGISSPHVPKLSSDNNFIQKSFLFFVSDLDLIITD
jgi:hypothetical protein